MVDRAPALTGLPAARRMMSWVPFVRRIGLIALAIGLATSISLAEISLGVLAVCLLVEQRRPLSLPIALPIVAFIAWNIVAALASARPLESLVAGRDVVWLASIYVVSHSIPDAAGARRFATLFFAAVAFVSVTAIVQVSACPAAPPDLPVLGRVLRKCGRAHGFYSIYMTLAGVLVLALVATLPRLGRASVPLSWGLPAWLAGVAALALTWARGAWVGFIVGCLGALMAARRRALVAGALVAVLLALLLVPGVFDRVVDRVRGIGRFEDNTLLDRLAMVDGGIRIARDHFWTGVGAGQVKHVYPVYAPPTALRRSTSHLHNTPLQVLVESGIVGLALWLGVFVAFFARSVRICRALDRDSDERALVAGVIAAIAGFLVSGLFEHNFGDTEVLLTACALMALPFTIERALLSRKEAR